jgi:ABC-type Fe3+/spermidine/putrescine transport system ATPase subunit
MAPLQRRMWVRGSSTKRSNRWPLVSRPLPAAPRQKQRPARAIVCEPKLILLDEPLAALDANLRRQMQVFLKQIQRRIKTTFVFVTHDQDEAITMSDRIVVMSQGRIEQLGTPKDLYYRPQTRFVAALWRQQSDRRPGRRTERLKRRWAPCLCLHRRSEPSLAASYW